MSSQYPNEYGSLDILNDNDNNFEVHSNIDHFQKSPGFKHIAIFLTIIISIIFGTFLISNIGSNSLHSKSNFFAEPSSTMTIQSSGSFPNDPTNPSIPTETIPTTQNTLSFKLARVGYEPITLDQTILNYRFLKDKITSIVEPSASMQLWVSGYNDNNIYYKFGVCADETGECTTGIMSLDSSMQLDVTIDCEPYDRYTITVQEYDLTTNQMTNMQADSALCLYVRREIRLLSETDLTKLMDSMYTMWTLSEDDGQELYGENFHTASYLLRFHHFNAAWQDSDHIHEGNGFLPQHIKMTNIFEKSIQSIDPSVSMPYWDFTIDDAAGKGAHNSVVMTSLIFGSMTQPTDLSMGFTYQDDLIIDSAIPDGRWAYLKSDLNGIYSELLSGYGYMRAPWNMNPSPYVSRFTMDLQIGISLPTCEQHYNILQETTLMNFFYQVQYDPHATTHSLTGGIYGCDLLLPLLEAGYISDETSMKTICSKWVFYLKEFYRYNYITPRTNCTVNETEIQSSTCGFTCVTDMEDYLLSNLETKIASNVPDTMGSAGWEAWKSFVCEGDGQRIFSGDHLESASPADPSFWVIHPTLERLLHAKLMAGGFQNETWTKNDYSGDLCDKANCYNSDYGRFDNFDDCCYGHGADSQIFDFVRGNRTNRIGDTNWDIFLATDPRSMSYSMPYIYDSFSWSHCGTETDFWSLMEHMASSQFR